MVLVKRPFSIALAVTYRSGYEEQVLRGVIDYRQQAHHWQFSGTGHLPFVHFEQIDLAAIDGIIGNFHSPPLVEAALRAGVAAVNYDSRLTDLPLPQVGPDDAAIGRMGADYLLQRGFAHIGFLTRGDDWYSQRRLAAFREVIEDQADRTCHVFTDDAGADPDDPDALGAWLTQLPKPIAVMAANDFRGRQLINVAVSMSLRVPDDVAVLGVDNDEWFTSLVATPLSSIDAGARSVGFRAAQMLDELLTGEHPPSPQWVAPVGVITRQSTDVVQSDDELVTRALRYIRDHCQATITVDDVLDELGVSRRSLEMRMKRALGHTPQAAIFRAQIDRARQMLVTTDHPMGRIARVCGFARQNHFNAVFRRLVGMTPSQYRQQHQPR